MSIRKKETEMEMTTDAEAFVARAEAAAAKVHVVADDAETEREVDAIRAEKGSDGLEVGVARAAKGIAQTGTCIVVTDDETVRLQTMLPEVSVILLKRSDILPDLPSAAPFLREQQTQGRASYVSFITGPSRTADIERVSAIGVHGPLELHIVLIGG